VWFAQNPKDTTEFEWQMRRKTHYVIQPDYLWNSITELARTPNDELLRRLQNGFDYMENDSFASTLGEAYKYLIGHSLQRAAEKKQVSFIRHDR
jgi:type I restriction enzyme M protein